MASEVDFETNGCIFQWKIENISLCRLKKKQPVYSPVFIAGALEGTKWTLILIPTEKKNVNDIDLYLYRTKYCSGPTVIDVKFELAFLDKDGLILKEETKSDTFKKGFSSGFTEFETQDQVFIFEREAYLPGDTLTVQCTLQKPGETCVKSQLYQARTVFKINKTSFDWRINRFIDFKTDEKKNYKDDLIEFSLVLNGHFEKKLDIEVIYIDGRTYCISCSTSVVNTDGKIENIGTTTYFLTDLKEGILSPSIHFPKSLMGNKSRYLRNDALSLNFKFVYLSVKYSYGEKNVFQEKKVDAKDKYHGTSVLIDELKSLCNEAIFCDTELRTPTKSFPAHKAILSARSPVFRNMFSHDMREVNSGHVDIIDFEDDTIHRMLLFIYTSVIDDLQPESASKLYVAADKYDIPSLKRICTSIIKKNLCPSNACDILLLADQHNDEDLKYSVEDYMLGQRKQIFSSQEWKDFMKNHTKLAADVMYKRMCQE